MAIEKEIPSVVLGEVDEVPPFPEEEIELEVFTKDSLPNDISGRQITNLEKIII